MHLRVELRRGAGCRVSLRGRATGRRGNSIGAPGFEPGTSPTRTVRATRLRYAPRESLSVASGAPSDWLPGSGDRLEIPDREPGHEGLEGDLDRHALALGPGREPDLLDLDALGEDVIDEIGVAVGEVRADRVQRGVGQRLQEGAFALAARQPPCGRTAPTAPVTVPTGLEAAPVAVPTGFVATPVAVPVAPVTTWPAVVVAPLIAPAAVPAAPFAPAAAFAALVA